MEKTAKNAGADNYTPSIPQYFSWINNTNEGATEEQTLINLDFFRYLKDTYGMNLRIYAWDAGNFDGASEGYGNVNSEKFRAQYPEGYKNVVEKNDNNAEIKNPDTFDNIFVSLILSGLSLICFVFPIFFSGKKK